jgi:predicted regulator of Ras-like GTPase activity (Roadblock/LC7/MglB family)
MDFKAILTEMIGSVDGAIGAGLVGLDGLVIDQVSVKADFDITVAGAEYATMIKNARKASENFGLGKTTEVLVSTESATMIMSAVGDQYFVAIALGLDGNLGRGRLEVKKAIPRLEKGLV